jgi:Holliday junction resolvase
MNRKSKGSNAERELVKMFWECGWAAVRVAGSGSSHFPNPDVLAGNISRKVAVECKTIHQIKKYLSGADVAQIQEFSKAFGAEPWIGIRFDSDKWYFLAIEDIEKTAENNFVISMQLAKRRGLIFSEFVGQFRKDEK